MVDERKKMKAVMDFLKRRYGKDVEDFIKRRHDPFKLLITTVLSQRTRDENTLKASENLFSKVNGPKDIVNMNIHVLEELIKPAGTFRQKARRIKEISKILIEKYGNDFPKTREELMKLPGVGPKTADIVLSYGFGVPNTAVDVHVEVCSKRLGFVEKNAKYEEIRKKLESLVKEKDRFYVNLGFVRFGQEICRTRNPRCDICPLKNMCDFYASHKKRG